MNDIPAKKERMLTFRGGGWVLVLSAFFSLVAAVLILWPAYQTGFRRAIGDGEHVETYGFDLSQLSVPAGKLIASGVPKDGIRAIPVRLAETIRPEEVDLIKKNEHSYFLVGEDRVIGVTVDVGEKRVARAYPLRVLTLHEVCNDVLGEGPDRLPICVSYSPLCDSAVVFDRRVDAAPLGTAAVDAAPEFGVSGLLINSNLVLYDRRSAPSQESLWSQLGLKAIAGPAVGKPLPLLPYELTTWSKWREKYPQTRVLLGLRTLKDEYRAEPYATYFHSDDVKFPVDPLWNILGISRKTPVIATSTDQKQWMVNPASPAEPALADAPHTFRIHSFLFAWYAMHAQDSDYSALTRQPIEK